MSSVSLPSLPAKRIGSAAELVAPGGSRPRTIGADRMMMHDGMSAQALLAAAPVRGLAEGSGAYTGSETYLQQAATIQIETPPSTADTRLANYDLSGFPLWRHDYRPDSWIQAYLEKLSSEQQRRITGLRRGNHLASILLTPAALNLVLAEELYHRLAPTPRQLMEQFPFIGIGHNQMPADPVSRTPRMVAVSTIGRTRVHSLFGPVRHGDVVWIVAERIARGKDETFVLDPKTGLALRPEEPVGKAAGLPVDMRPRLTGRPLRVRFVCTRGEAPYVPLCETEDGIEQEPFVAAMGRIMFVGQRGNVAAATNGNVNNGAMRNATQHDIIVGYQPIE